MSVKEAISEGTLCKPKTPKRVLLQTVKTQTALPANTKLIFRERNTIILEIITCDPIKYKMDYSMLIVSICVGNSIGLKKVK